MRADGLERPKAATDAAGEIRAGRRSGGKARVSRAEIAAWLARVCEMADPDFPDREQPPMPPDKDIFD